MTPYEDLCERYERSFKKRVEYEEMARGAVFRVLVALRERLQGPNQAAHYAPPEDDGGDHKGCTPQGAVRALADGWWGGRLIVTLSRPNQLPIAQRGFVVKAFVEPDTGFVTYDIGHWNSRIKIAADDAGSIQQVLDELINQARSFIDDQLNDFIQAHRPE